MKHPRLLILLSVLYLSVFICSAAFAQDDTCRSVQDVISVIRDCRRTETASFSVSCDEATYDKLRADGDGPLWDALHQGGMQSFGDCQILHMGAIYTFTFSSVTYYAEYTVCTSLKEVEAAIGKYRQRGTTSFTLVCSAAAYSTIESKDNASFWYMIHSCGIDNGSVSYGSNCYIFSGVTYLGSYAVCTSLAEAQNAVSLYVAGGVTSFDLVCSPELFQYLEKLDNGEFWRIWRSLGIDQADASWNTCLYGFRNVTFMEHTIRCDSLQDVRNAISGYARDQVTTYALVCGTDVYRQLSANDFAVLHKMCASYGIYRENFSHSDGSRMILFKDAVYYPGYRVFRMYETGREAFLNAEERQLLDTAKRIVAQAGRGISPLEMERYLHDYICQNVTYYSSDADGFSVYDTAIGALLYGRADCDGYSDAFCLLCSLADIPVRMVSGYADNDGAAVIREVRENAHAWNLVSLDGGKNWYMVDVTWDDGSSGRILYNYFNTGRKAASASRVWKDEAVNVNWALYDDVTIGYYSGRFEGRLFYSLDDAVSYMLRTMNGSSAELDAKIDGVYGPDEVMDTLGGALRQQGGGWNYGYTSYYVDGGSTYVILYAEVTR
ncbi:MAG: hypothetical protein CW338_06925 [Clostridiales bacterium]|nr:hypothetical protein [Clostridiales bacterium]